MAATPMQRSSDFLTNTFDDRRWLFMHERKANPDDAKNLAGCNALCGDMDLVILPQSRTLDINPLNPNFASATAKAIQSNAAH